MLYCTLRQCWGRLRSSQCKSYVVQFSVANATLCKLYDKYNTSWAARQTLNSLRTSILLGKNGNLRSSYNYRVQSDNCSLPNVNSRDNPFSSHEVLRANLNSWLYSKLILKQNHQTIFKMQEHFYQIIWICRWSETCSLYSSHPSFRI